MVQGVLQPYFPKNNEKYEAVDWKADKDKAYRAVVKAVREGIEVVSPASVNLSKLVRKVKMSLLLSFLPDSTLKC